MDTPQSIQSNPAESTAGLNAELRTEQRFGADDEAALRRARLIEFLEEMKVNPAWKDEDHPELADGSGAWVRKLRGEWKERLEKLEAHRNAD